MDLLGAADACFYVMCHAMSLFEAFIFSLGHLASAYIMSTSNVSLDAGGRKMCGSRPHVATCWNRCPASPVPKSRTFLNSQAALQHGQMHTLQPIFRGVLREALVVLCIAVNFPCTVYIVSWEKSTCRRAYESI